MTFLEVAIPVAVILLATQADEPCLTVFESETVSEEPAGIDYHEVEEICLTGGAPGDYAPVDFAHIPSAPVPAAVPEPATWALMIAGFGLCGAALRARRARA